MLTQVNALPDTQIKSAVSNRNTNTAAKEAILNVGRHVVVGFIIMPVVRGFFWRKLIEMTFQILTNYRSGFSLIVNDADVCLINKCNNPHSIRFKSGIALNISSVIR